MALVECNFDSEVLELSTTMSVILPDLDCTEDKFKKEEKYPVLYLLHGLSDDHTAWTRKTAIERYVEKYKLAVVMPEVHRSFYSNMLYGNDYWTFISEEVPFIAGRYFPLSSSRSENFVCGLSMGGYGAFKLGLRCPDKFAAAASLSGALDIATLFEENEEDEEEDVEEFSYIFGELSKLRNSQSDLMYLLQKQVEAGVDLPDLYQCCGQDDFLYDTNLNFKELAQELGVNLTYEEDAGEEHQWSYWDQKIQKVLQWLPLKKIDQD